MKNLFSRRLGHKPREIDIFIRNDAPVSLREFLIQLVYDLGYKPSFIRRSICRVLRVSSNRNNWTEFPNIDGEVNQLLLDCEWYYVYDIMEYLWNEIDTDRREEYQEELNDYFKSNGIGWKMEYGQIEIRGDQNFESTILETEETLEKGNLQTARSEIIEAITDLSRRPNPDITGAIQHSLACLECVCREVTGDKKATLGELVKKFPEIVPKPLDISIEKLWGYTSEQGRHLHEGNLPNYDEAELVVAISSAISNYLGKKFIIKENISDSNDFQF